MAGLLSAGVLFAASALTPPVAGWVSLFNGKDLTGWVKVGQEKWDVEDGTIHGQGITKEYGYLPGHHTGGISGDGCKWIVWPSPENELVLRPDDWNEFLLKVEGNRYVARLNGVLVVDFIDPAPVSHDGYIALQLHSGGQGNMRFKDIFVRDLSQR